jgi:release factor glutamine methyltransferase
MTLQEWCKKGQALLSAGPHPFSARRDAERLLQQVVHRERAGLLARWNEPLSAEEAAQYVALMERRLAGEPIQYILGETEFYGLPFRVTRDVLIPRPETEHLVEKALDLAKGFARPRIVDIGAGSGAIAVTLAHHLPGSVLTAIDISAAALEIAKHNAKRNAVDLRFFQGDLLMPVTGEQFEMVLSNPPYVPATDRSSLAVEVREYEPELALFAGDDGLQIYRRLIPAAFHCLIPGGYVLLEIGFNQSPAIAALLAAAGFQQSEFLPDLQGIPRVACARRL